MSLLGRRRRVCGMSICAKISPAGGPIPPVGRLARPRPPFVPVPTGLSPYSTMLTILSISGATSLPATPLAYLNASGGAAYVQGQSGGSVAVGDRLLLSTTAIRPATGTGSRTVRRFSLSAPCNEPHGLGAGLRLRH